MGQSSVFFHFIRYNLLGKKGYDIIYGFALRIKFRNLFAFAMTATVTQPDYGEVWEADIF